MTGVVTVATYNTHAGKDSSGVLAQHVQVADLLSHSVDVVALQELDFLTGRSSRADQLKALASGAGFSHTVFGPAMVHDGGLYGNGILSRFPLSDVLVVPFRAVPPDGFHGGFSHEHMDGKTRPWPAKAEPRTVVFAKVSSPLGPFWFGSSHMSTFPRERARAASDLHAVVDSLGSLPVVLGMDSNAADPSEPFWLTLSGLLSDLTVSSPAHGAPTFPSVSPVHRVDALWGRGVSSLAAGLIESAGTDHLGLWATISF